VAAILLGTLKERVPRINLKIRTSLRKIGFRSLRVRKAIALK